VLDKRIHGCAGWSARSVHVAHCALERHQMGLAPQLGSGSCRTPRIRMTFLALVGQRVGIALGESRMSSGVL